VSTRPRSAGETPAAIGERALRQATRALAGATDLDVGFGAPVPGQPATTLRLPPVNWPLAPGDAARIRGHADHLALRSAYHDALLHARFRPTGARAREIFDAVEDMRCQCLGGNVLAGVAQNLTAALNDTLSRKPGPRPWRRPWRCWCARS
jgi:cobaltochelatase CobT